MTKPNERFFSDTTKAKRPGKEKESQTLEMWISLFLGFFKSLLEESAISKGKDLPFVFHI